MSDSPHRHADTSDRSRREFLRRTGAATGLAAVLGRRSLAMPVQATIGDHGPHDDESSRPPEVVFPQSVASGGPTSEGVILWTRISPDAHVDGQPLGVEVATSDGFTGDDVVYRGSVASDAIGAEHDYTVKVDLAGHLDPDSEYAYRFTYRGTRSRTGRCRTLPDPDASPEGFDLAVVTCQDYQNGYYGALHHVAAEDVDFLVHLGDFIYESAAGQWKGEYSPDLEDRDITLPSGHDIAYTLADFRHLHRTYRSDRFLQEALEAHTLIAGWDDHEVANNWYWDYEAGAPQAPHHPRGDDPAFMAELTADGIQSWVEYLPARVEYDPGADHLQEMFQLYRTFDFGDLATLVVTDERLFRNQPPCSGEFYLEPTCDVDADRTMLGDGQLQWFIEQLDRADARGTWTLWANEVMYVPLEAGEREATGGYRPEAWGGYESERREIANHLKENDVENFVALTGDLHAYLAGYLQVNYEDSTRDPSVNPLADPENRVGVELMTPAVTSINLSDQLPGETTPAHIEATEAVIEATNPHVDLFDGYRWGYSVVEITSDDCLYRAYSVDKLDDSPDAEKELVAVRRVPEGENRLEEPDGIDISSR